MMRPRTTASLLAAAAAFAAGQVCIAARAEVDRTQPGLLAGDEGVLGGERFGGVELGAELVVGRLEFSGQRAWTWQVAEPAGPDTQRLLLEGRVRVVIGDYAFNAERAAVWVQPVAVGGVGEAVGVYRVFAVLDEVRTPGAAAVFAFEADRLPVQGLIAATQRVVLRADARLPGPPPSEDRRAFLEGAEEDFARALLAASGVDLPVEAAPPPPRPTPLPIPGVARTPPPWPEAGDNPPATDEPSRDLDERPQAAPGDGPAPAEVPTPFDPGGAAGGRPIFDGGGVFYVSAGDRVTVSREEGLNAVQITGGVVVQYDGPQGTLELTAERGVVFLRGAPLAEQLSRLSAEDVLGIYLEGGFLATDGSYTVRGPRVYYDVASGRALLIDAVFWAFEPELNTSLYMRAAAIRQESANEFSAERATFANTAFFTPHIAIGARDVTLTRRPDAEGALQNTVDARGVTLRSGGVPLLYVPRLRGEPGRFPLRTINVSDTNRQGVNVRSDWDPFALLGIEPPEGVEGRLDIDYFADRNFATGGLLEWSTPTQRGGLLAYILPDDEGVDITPSGTAIERDGDFRSVLVGKQRWQFRPEWTFIAEGFFASDETATGIFFEELAERGDELTSRAHLRRLEGQSLLTVEAKASATDFISNEHLLQAPGYLVDKLPEIEYGVVANDLLADVAPGLLTHTWSAGATALRLRFSEVDAASLGLETPQLASGLLGLAPGQSAGELFRAQGLDEDLVFRFDTRHELAAVLDAGPIRINPFVVGRVTAYDDTFVAFSPGDTDRLRLWGAAGARLSTSFQRIDNDIESRTFDLHRIRHIVEPSVTVWSAGTNLEVADLPVFDDDVESILEGTAVRVALDQTWQTKRGGPGRWRSVDVLTVSAEYAWHSSDTDRQTPIGRFFDARPELGVPGEFGRLSAVWQVSEIVAISGETIWDFETSREDRNSLGLLINHGSRLSGTLEYRSIESQGDAFVESRVSYRFAEKYRADAFARFNTAIDTVDIVGLVVLRQFAAGLLGVRVGFDNVTSETSFGIEIRPFQSPDLAGGLPFGGRPDAFGIGG